MSFWMGLSRRRSAGKTEIQSSPSVHCFAGKTENKISPQRDFVRGTHKNQTSPSGRIVRERHKIKTSPQKPQSAGNTEFQSFPCCGEDTTPSGINKNPASVVTGVGKDGLQLSPPCPFPLPVTKKFRSKKIKFNTLTR